MATRKRAIPVSEFKAKCLRLVDEVGRTGREIVITKHGKAIVVVRPVRPARPTLGRWRGQVAVEGDIVRSDWSGEFEASRD